MDLTKEIESLHLSPQDIEELSRPFGPKEAMEAMKLGFAMGLSELQMTPGEFEELAKAANVIFNPMDILGKGVEGYGQAAAALIGVGAVGGAYSGYARHRIDHMLAGNDDPQVVALRRKIDAYHNMRQDLERSNNLRGVEPQPTAIA